MRSRARTFLGAAVALSLGPLLAHQAQRHLDPGRRADQSLLTGRVAPDRRLLASAALGQQTLLADLLWVRAVLTFVDLADAPTDQGREWVRSMVQGVNALDPEWRTAYFYGGSLLRVIDDIEGSNQVFEAGTEALPDDPYFAFSRAMNAYLYEDDVQTAQVWMERAAETPGAPPWYRAAAGGMLRRSGDKDTALRYLQEQLATIDDERAQAALRHRYRSLLHEKLSDELTASLHAWEAETGQRLTDLDAIQDRLPDDPYGKGWILAPDHVVRSVEAERRATDDARRIERGWLLHP